MEAHGSFDEHDFENLGKSQILPFYLFEIKSHCLGSITNVFIVIFHFSKIRYMCKLNTTNYFRDIVDNGYILIDLIFLKMGDISA